MLGAAILVVAMALGAACSNSSAPIPSPSPPPVGTAGPAGLGGTWVLQQALQASDVDSASVETALSARGILGYSIRVPWSAVDGTSSILDQALRVARAHNVALAIRFMAGRWTPARVFASGSPFYRVNGSQVPSPFDAQAQPNRAFEAAYRGEVAFLAAWCRRDGVHLLHLPWYGQNYAELNNGKEVRSAPGYSYPAWVQAHERLFDIAWSDAGPDLAIEFPLSGYGPLVGASGDLARYISSKTAGLNGRVYVQANGLDSRGDWGAASPGIEQQMEQAVWTQPLPRGEQMIGVRDYDWDAVYARLHLNHAAYVEIYASSFAPGLPHHDALLRDVLAYSKT